MKVGGVGFTTNHLNCNAMSSMYKDDWLDIVWNLSVVQRITSPNIKTQWKC